MYNYHKTRHSTSSESETSRPLMHYYYQEPPVNPIHMQAYGVNPQYYPTPFEQVSLNSYPSLLPNPPYMQETYDTNYYEPPRTPDTQYFTPHYQDTSTACESEVEHDKIPHRRKRNQRKPRTQPSQLNGSIPNKPQFEPLQPTMPTSPRQFQFHPQPGQKAGCHREKPNNGTNTPKEKVEDRETNNGNGSYLGHISQIVATIHFLCCLCATLLCFSMLPSYGATLRQ